MATTLTSTTFSTTYKDDFKDSDNYYRILFNAGRALQARELTQMQTMMHREIERFGSNIFREGGVVRAGNVTLNNSYEFIKLVSGTELPTSLVNKVATAGGISVRILELKNSKSTAAATPPTIYVRYEDTTGGTAGTTPVRIQNGATLAISGEDDLVVASTDATGRGSTISVDNGDYFVQGHFVFVKKQTIFLNAYTNTHSGIVGFKLTEDVVSSTDDTALFDNQGAVPNVAAPGADRYRITLTLTKKEDLAADDNFIYLVKLDQGVVVDTSSEDDAYNRIVDLLAIRTKEESGDYVVKNFIAKINDLNDSNLEIDMSSGIAYVDGYRLDIPQRKITLPKAQDTLLLNDQKVIVRYGNYVVGASNTNKGIPDIDSNQLVSLNNDSGYGGTDIGTARVRAIEEFGANTLKYYLMDINMNSGQEFSTVKSFGTSTSDFTNIVLEGGNAVLKSTGDNHLLLPLPQKTPSATGVSVDNLTVARRYSFVSDGSGEKTLATNANGQDVGTFKNTGDWIIAKFDASIDSTTATFSLDSVGATVDITGLDATTNYEMIAYVDITAPTHSTKIKRTRTITKVWPDSADSDGNGLQYIDLGRPDIISVASITQTDSAGADLSTSFTVDNGQRDNFYALGRAIKKPGTPVPSGTIQVVYDHFDIQTLNDFFSVNSYENSGVTYENIPNHRKNNGEVISLRDVLDFRPYQDSTGSFVHTETVHSLPQVTDLVDANVTYYLPRKDRLVASTENSKDGRLARGSLKLVQGVSGFDPQFPEIPTGAIPLYDISLNAYTLNDSDVETSFYDNRRYTMKDISRLERRIDELQELTTLSLLETNTSTFAVYDSAGNARTKAGFIADAFSNYAFSNIGDGYRAEIDPVENILKPQIYPNTVRLVFDSAGSTAERKGDLLLLPIASDVSLINQNLATETMNVNPYSVITNNGHTDLSPASDTWVEIEYAPDNIVDGGTITRNVGSRTTTRALGNWQASWFGRPAGRSVNVITGSRVIREFVGERVLDIQIIPFMRSVKVNFRAQGLRPKTRFFPFFGGVEISDYAKQLDSFERFSLQSDDYGNIYTDATSHPDGSTNLVSNDFGELNGNFIIPSNSSLKYRTGTETFKLLDISVDNENAALSKAKASFTSSGVLETRQRTIKSTRQLDLVQINRVDPPDTGNDGGGGGDGGGDPLAQSFRVDPYENPNGIFVTKINTYFATKSTTGVPVWLQLRTMENGIPTEASIPGSMKYLRPGDVNIPADINNLTSVRGAPTTFEFDEPVYLEPGSYAIVLGAETTEYTTYVAQTYSFILGSTEARVDKQPTLGTLFSSQNAQTWSPDQTKDLMFEIFRAEFDTSATAVVTNGSVPTRKLVANPIVADSASSTVRILAEGHGLSKGDKVLLTGIDSASTFTGAGLPGYWLDGTRAVLNVDHTGFTFAADSAASTSLRVGGNQVITTQNIMYNSFLPTVQTLLPDLTSLSANVVTTGSGGLLGELSYADKRNSGLSSGMARGDSANITLNELNFTNEPKVILSDSNETFRISGNKSFEMRLNFSTTDNKVSPIVDLQRMSFTGFENIIDKQDSAATVGFNVPLAFVNETHPTEGSAAAKHVSTVVTLEEEAVGLKILIAANRPSSADFEVYYKTGLADEVLSDKNWIEVAKEAAITADNDPTTFREYEYLAGGVGGSLTPFTQYQVKIVMNTTNSSQIPVFRDLRAIALVT